MQACRLDMNFHLLFLQYKCGEKMCGETGRGEVCGLITPKTWCRTLYLIGFISSHHDSVSTYGVPGTYIIFTPYNSLRRYNLLIPPFYR